jgi:hypothetical protein
MKLSRFVPFLLLSALAVLLGSCQMFNSLLSLPNQAVKAPAGTTADDEYDLAAFTHSGWSETAEGLYIHLELDKWYKITVPVKPANFDSSLWGSNPYTSDSSLALAAQHAGAITSSGGAFYVKIQGAGSDFYSSTANGITSTAYGDYLYSYEVFLAP